MHLSRKINNNTYTALLFYYAYIFLLKGVIIRQAAYKYSARFTVILQYCHVIE
jgi:hypothetical protein